jgi:3-oxoacyl-[acyl-carrier-protein] synthase III
LAQGMGADVARFPMTVPTYGNMGPAAVPFTLAQHVDQLQPGMQVLLMGIGSGLNTSLVEITW